MKIKNKIISIIIIMITLINISGISNAVVIDTTSAIVTGWYGDIQYSYNGEEQKAVRMSCNNIPVYALKKNNAGGLFYPEKVEIYTNNAIKNIIKNGYGCKTVEELNCLTMEEAYLATQEAIYIELEGRNIDDYVITGNQGNRILNATKQILQDAKAQKDIIEIVIKNEYWQEYEKDTNYKYKEIEVKAENANPGKIEILNGFNKTDKELIKMAKTFNCTKLGLLTKIVIPANIGTFINSLKVNIGLSLVGVISGEFLVSKAGLRIPDCIWRPGI